MKLDEEKNQQKSNYGAHLLHAKSIEGSGSIKGERCFDEFRWKNDKSRKHKIVEFLDLKKRKKKEKLET